jgi:acyl carrier protein
MGLGQVELVMEVEERFDIKLPDSRCERIKTVADLAAAVISMQPQANGPCPSARAFYDLRRTLVWRTGVGKRSVRPGSLIADVIPSPRAVWSDLRLLHPRLPSLELSREVDAALLWSAAIGVLGLVVFIAWSFDRLGWSQGVLLAVAGLIVIMVASMIARASLASQVPGHLVTVGDLARTLAVQQAPEPGSGAYLIHQAQVLREVRELVAAQVGLPLERVLPESLLLEDLGLD